MWTVAEGMFDPDLAPCSWVQFADDGRLLAMNEPAIALLGLPRERLVGLRFDDLLTPGARVFHQMMLAPMLKLQGRVDEVTMTLRGAAGTDLHVLVCGSRRVQGDQGINQCVLVPVNERRKLEESLARMRRAAEKLPGVMFELEVGEKQPARFTYIGPGVARLIGIEAGELMADAGPLLDALHPEDRGRVLTATRPRTLDGEASHLEFRVLHRSRQEAVWLESHATPRRLPDGRVLWNGYLADIGAQRRMHEQLRDNDKLRVTAQLAAGVAHDFNNMLGSISGLAELCLLQAQEGSRLHRNLGRILESGGKAARLVRQLLDYSRQTPQTLTPTCVGEWLALNEPLLRVHLRPNVALTVEARVPGRVKLDAVRMQQVMFNLVNNAVYAMREKGGTVRVTLDECVGTDNPLRRPAMRLCVGDEGCGIAPEQLGQIFQPFYTTKPVGEGTGLGLSAVHGVVSSHDGQIQAHSELGRGTTFTIWLPLLQD